MHERFLDTAYGPVRAELHDGPPGDRDEATHPDVLERIDSERLVVPGADHSLEVGDPLSSVEALRTVVTEMDRFVGDL